jgi:hypothetical protein
MAEDPIHELKDFESRNIYLLEIQRMSLMTSTLNRMNDETVEEHLENAEEYKKSLNL